MEVTKRTVSAERSLRMMSEPLTDDDLVPLQRHKQEVTNHRQVLVGFRRVHTSSVAWLELVHVIMVEGIPVE